MIDIQLIRRDPDAVLAALRKRGDEVRLDDILEADRRRRELVDAGDRKRGERKQIASEIGRLRASGEDADELQATATALRDEVAQIEDEQARLDEHLRELLLSLPNMPDERVPAGGKEANQVVKTVGEPPALENPLDHVELSTRLGLVDYERGTKLGGSGFWIYTGLGAALEWALLDFFCREHYRDGYTFLLPPHILLEEAGYASGQFPKFREDVYHLDPRLDRNMFLLPTAETAIVNVYRDEILAESDLPLKTFAYTPCYRREAGSHRSEERGTVRGHQFNKVEAFQFVTPEGSDRALQELVGKAESLVEQLGLHYRTSLLAAADTSAAMQVTYDVEVWIPSIGTYKEVSSVSAAGEYQARRAQIRYRREGEKRPQYVHTLNGSALATSRLVPALLEQHQRPDGSVAVPEPLRAWLGTDVLSPR